MYTFDLIGCWDYGVFLVFLLLLLFLFSFSYFLSFLFCFVLFFSTTPNRKALDNTQIRFINVITWLLS